MENAVTQPDPLASLVLPIIISLLYGVIIHFLAKEKGRKVTLWTILGFIPIVNMFLIPFFVGAANLRLEEKIDQLLTASKK